MSSIKESVPPSHSHAAGQRDNLPRSGTARGTDAGTSDLKALADRVLRRDNGGTTARTEKHNPSQGEAKLLLAAGTSVLDFIAAIEERAAILQFEAADVFPSGESATAGAFEELRGQIMKGEDNGI